MSEPIEIEVMTVLVSVSMTTTVPLQVATYARVCAWAVLILPLAINSRERQMRENRKPRNCKESGASY